MKVLLAFDGSAHSHAALVEVASRRWPAHTEIEVLTVVHSRWPVVGDPFFTVASAHIESMLEQQHDAPKLLEGAVAKILELAPRIVAVSSKTLEGVPHDVIVKEAEDWGADLIVLGSHGYGPIRRALLGSVAAAVAVEAPCPVEIIRSGRPPVAVRQAKRETGDGLRSSPDPSQ
jgi:nucleotide-binding universal stress UspA family protein